MNITIIGTGNVGGALAHRLSAAGHNITLGVRDTNEFKGKEQLSGLDNLQIQSIPDSIKNAEVILLCTPAHVVLDIIPLLGDVNDKIIIDTTNAVRMKPEPYNTAFGALRATTKASIVKCFNSTGFENMTNPIYEQIQPVSHSIHLDMYMAGSDHSAKDIARKLAIDAGFEACHDFGGDDKVELLEQFALSWINLAIMQGMGRDIAFKLIKRGN